MTTKTKRPLGDRGQGQKSVGTGQQIGRSPVLQIRVSAELRAKVKRKGAQWARDVLTDAE